MFLLTFNRRFKSSSRLLKNHNNMEEMQFSTTLKPDLEHPEDAQYIWLPILVLVGVFVLAGLVYAMSRSRRLFNCVRLKRRNATRNGYASLDEEESDVPMAEGEDFGDRNSISSLRDARLQITPRQGIVHLDVNDDVLRA